MRNLAIFGGQKIRNKPFPKWPQFKEIDESALIEVLHSNNWNRGANSNNSDFISKFENKIKEMLDVKYCIGVSSGSCALDLAAKGAKIIAEDEVIVPAYTFISSISCVIHAGAKPIFTDIDPKTWNIDPVKVEENITNKTKAIIVVHFAGQPANMDAIQKLAAKYNLIVIEDAAQAVGASWKNLPVGSIGDIGCFSLEGSKNITAGEGGFITTKNKFFFEEIYSLQNCGRKLNGPWYQHENIGWNNRITEFQAAIAYNQLKTLESYNSIRQENALYLKKLLQEIPGIEVTEVDGNVTSHAFHLITMRYKKAYWNRLGKNRFILALNAEGIPCYAGYKYPVYENPVFKKLGYDVETIAQKCKIAKQVTEESIWLPQNLFLGNKNDIDDIVKAFIKIKDNLNSLKR